MMDSTDVLNIKDEEIDHTDSQIDNEEIASVVSVQSTNSDDSDPSLDGDIPLRRAANHELDNENTLLKLADSRRKVYYQPDSKLMTQESDDSDPSLDRAIPPRRATEPLETHTPTPPVSNSFVKPIIEPISAVTKRSKDPSNDGDIPPRRSNAGRKRVFDDEERRQRYNAYHRHLYQKQKLERQKKDQELALLKHKLNLLTSRSSERAELTRSPMPKQTDPSRDGDIPPRRATVSRFESSFQATDPSRDGDIAPWRATPCMPTYVWTNSGSNGETAVEELNSMEQMADALRDTCCALQQKGLLSTFSLTQK